MVSFLEVFFVFFSRRKKQKTRYSPPPLVLTCRSGASNTRNSRVRKLELGKNILALPLRTTV